MPSPGPSFPDLVQGAGDMTDARLYASAFTRNGDPIRERLKHVLPQNGLILEIASGSGEHLVHIARMFTWLMFQPSDPDPAARASINAWSRHAGVANMRPALALDAAADWPLAQADAILCINMVHIAPWAATEGLFRNAARLLRPGGTLTLYGPFDRAGLPLAPGNAAFDADLRARNPAWGLRHLDDLTALATSFMPPGIIDMPANNIMATYQRSGA
jgi:SAM-dependent methyltransferase